MPGIIPTVSPSLGSTWCPLCLGGESEDSVDVAGLGLLWPGGEHVCQSGSPALWLIPADGKLPRRPWLGPSPVQQLTWALRCASCPCAACPAMSRLPPSTLRPEFCSPLWGCKQFAANRVAFSNLPHLVFALRCREGPGGRPALSSLWRSLPEGMPGTAWKEDAEKPGWSGRVWRVQSWFARSPLE